MIVDTLKVFVTVVEQSHFSRAAEKLNLSQPGVSLHIRNLENEFGSKLLHRTSKHVKMTEAGSILYNRAKQILALYEEAREEIHLLRDEVTGSVNIGASYTIGEYVLPHLLAEYTNVYPLVETYVTIANTEEITRAVRANELDLGLVEGEVDVPELRTSPPFAEDEMVLVAPPVCPLCSMGSVDVSKLQDQTWVYREPGSGTRAYSDRFIMESGLRVQRSFVFNSNQGVKEAVMAGLGIAVLSRLVIRKELESGELCGITIKGRRMKRNFSILQDPKSPSTMAVTMFIRKLGELESLK
ncbi:LysR family transcriptional regulator [Paenibacillus sp. J2TS4]|uniref:LysR family transcriptional regulator n=1 Tax=Paenibacillus sp. J2TS4 TaxID=2807194 RepID=UPI001AFD434B|nr:LysR family transcriptional regulator [Paenibacillus sp. J2TS4]GIP32250.1 LysR family transcriptional regulator [Paenibacillus sp. J2TS4]